MVAAVVAGGLVIGGNAIAGEDPEGTDADYAQDSPVGGKSGTNLGNEAAGSAAVDEGGSTGDAADAGADETAADALGAEGESATDEAQSAAR